MELTDPHPRIILWAYSNTFITLHRLPVGAPSDNDISSYKKVGGMFVYFIQCREHSL